MFLTRRKRLLFAIIFLFILPFIFADQPTISFVNPTPSNGSQLSGNSLPINITSGTGDIYTFLDLDGTLIGWYRLNNDSSAGENDTNVRDWSRYSNNGTIRSSNAALNSSGRLGGAFSSNGIDDNLNGVDLGTSNIYNLTGENFTISAWVMTFDNTTLNQVIFARGSVASGALQMNYNLRLTATVPRPTLTVSDGSALLLTGSAPSDNLNNNVWYHIVGRFNGTSAAIYRNGVMTASSTNATFGLVANNAGRDETGIGGDFDNLRMYLNGSIDEVIVFNRSLSDAEILSLYNATANKYYRNFTLADGVHRFTGYVVNGSGSMNQTGERVVLLGSDTITPVMNITSPANTTYLTSEILINFTATDNSFVTSLWFYNESTNVTYTVPTYINVSSGSHTFLFYANDSSGNLNTTSRTFVINDSTAPSFSNYQNSPDNGTNYSQNAFYEFNVTVPGVSSVWINWAGTNYTNTYSRGGNVYSFNRTDLAAEAYNYRWYANSTGGTLNDSGIRSYTVTTASPNVTIYLNNSLTFYQMNNSLTNLGYIIRNNATIWINVSVNTSQSRTLLYRDGTLINNGTGNIANITNFVVSETSYVNYTATFQANQNYTSGIDTKLVKITHPQAIARWNVVPYQEFNGSFNIGIVAFHIDGISKVEFIYANKSGMQNVNVTNMTLNPRVGNWEYWTMLNASEFNDGLIQINATVYPVNGENRYLRGPFNTTLNTNLSKGEHSMYLNPNNGGTLWRSVKYVSHENGSDSTGNGSLTNPFKSMNMAARNITLESPNGTADGGIIYLLAGYHPFCCGATNASGSFIGYVLTENRYVTIMPAPGLNKSDVIINESRSGLRTTLQRVVNVTVTAGLGGSGNPAGGGQEGIFWTDNVDFIGPGGDRHTPITWISTTSFAGGEYVTNSYMNGSQNGFSSLSMLRNTRVEKIGADTTVNTLLVLNLTVDDINGMFYCGDGIDNDGDGQIDYPNDTECTSLTDDNESAAGFQDGIHTDGIQYFTISPPLENVIIYNIIITNLTGQGFHIDYTGHNGSGGPWFDFAMVNFAANATLNSYFLPSVDHALLWHLTLNNNGLFIGNSTGGTDEDGIVTDLSIRNSVLKDVYFAPAYPSSNSPDFVNNHIVKNASNSLSFIGINYSTEGIFEAVVNVTNGYYPISNSVLLNRIPGNGSLIIPADLYSVALPTNGSAAIGAVQLYPDSGSQQSNSSDTTTPNVTNLVEAPSDPAPYVSGQTYKFNATIVDDVNISRVLFEINSVNYTVNNVGNVYNFTITDLAVGTYNYLWRANDTSNNVNVTTGSYTINRATPTLNLTLNGTQGNVSMAQGSNIVLNGTTITGDAGTLLLYNNGTLINNATSVNNNTEFSNVGLHNITLIYVQSQNYSSTSLTYWVNVTAGDVAPYPLLLGTNGASTTSASNYFAANFTDDSQLANATLYLWSGTTLVGTNATAITGTSNSTNLSLTFSSTGTYLWNYLAVDNSSRSRFNNTNYSITYSTTSSSSSSSGGGGGGAAESGFWTTTYAGESQGIEQINEVRKELGGGQRIKVIFENEDHYVGVISLTGTTVVINVSSIPQQRTFNIGDSHKFELDGDNYYDLLVTLRAINNSKADVVIRYLHELFVPEAEEQEGEEQEQNSSNEESSEQSSTFDWMFYGGLGLGIIIVLILLAVIFLKRPPHRRSYEPHGKKGHRK